MHSISKNHYKQAGAAIFMAMLVVTLVAALAITLNFIGRVDIRRTQLVLTQVQAYWYSQGVVNWAIGVLNHSPQNNNSDATPTIWPKIFPLTNIPNGNISGKLENYQARFNINSITNTEERNRFTEFLMNLTSLSPEQITELEQNIQTWITPLDPNSSRDIIDSVFLQQNPPYHAAHRPMVTPSELRLIPGMQATAYEMLQPYISALPPQTPSNITFDNQKHIQPIDASPSNYYLVQAQVQLNNQVFTLYCLLHKQNAGSVKILWQSFGAI